VCWFVVGAAIVEFGLFFKNYLNYPLYSADFWGFQAGPKEYYYIFPNAKK